MVYTVLYTLFGNDEGIAKVKLDIYSEHAKRISRLS